MNQELSNIFNELWRLDVNRMKPGIDYNISVQVWYSTSLCGYKAVIFLSSVLGKRQVYGVCVVQGKADFVNHGSHTVRDHASQPLFSNVNENKLVTINTFSRKCL